MTPFHLTNFFHILFMPLESRKTKAESVESLKSQNIDTLSFDENFQKSQIYLTKIDTFFVYNTEFLLISFFG